MAMWARLAGLRLLGQVFVLAAMVALGWLLLCPLSYGLSGVDGLVASAVAALVCLAGGELGLLVAAAFRGPMAAMNGAVLGMLVRMVVPLFGGVAIHLMVPRLADAGFVFYLVAFYMVDLAAEIMLLLAANSRVDRTS